MNIVYHYNLANDEGDSSSFSPTYDLVEVLYTTPDLAEDKKVTKPIEHLQQEVRDLLFTADNVMFARTFNGYWKVGYFFEPGANNSEWTYHLDDLVLKLEEYINNVRVMNILYQLKLCVRFEGRRLMYQLILLREYVPQHVRDFQIEIRKHLIDTFLIDNKDV